MLVLTTYVLHDYLTISDLSSYEMVTNVNVFTVIRCKWVLRQRDRPLIILLNYYRKML